MSSPKKARIALLGYGETNKAILQNDANANFDVFDDSFDDSSSDNLGNNFYPSSKYLKNNNYIKQIITPGIPPHHDLAKKSQTLISDYDYFKNDFPFSVWISGTNGKTTLTQMLHHLLGEEISQMGSNIGVPIASMDTNKPIWILETSSFTLHYTTSVHPNIYLLLPIMPDHVSWHNNFEEYENAKLKPLLKMDSSCIAIIPACYKHINTNAKTIYYENEEDLAKHMNIDITKVTIKQPFKISAILALSAQKILFNKADIQTCNTFKVDAHKMEEFTDKQNRIWVDDSKATNISASKEAIKRYKDKKIHLVLGGDSKQVSLEPLIKFIKDFDINIYAIGNSANNIEELSQTHNINCKNCKTMQNAIIQINSCRIKNDVGILSPACASFDQFSSYKDRGEVFKKLIYAL